VWGVCSSTKAEKTKIGYIPVYRKGFENKENSDFLIPIMESGNLNFKGLKSK